MKIRKALGVAAIVVFAFATRGAAESIIVTSGYIQTYDNGSSFIFTTNDGRSWTGDTEGLGQIPIFIAGHSGDVVNLSNSVNPALTGFSIYDPDRRDLAARAIFTFHAGNAVLPSAEAVNGARDGLGLLSVPFSFTGSLFVYPTYAARAAGGAPTWQYDLTGRGSADAMLRTSMTPDGQPIVSYSGVYTFDADPSAPVPEPGTLLLFASGAAAVAVRRRRRTQS